MSKSYYYAVGAERHGPISETELDSMVTSGELPQDTLVWTEGMENWQPYVIERGTPLRPDLPPRITHEAVERAAATYVVSPVDSMRPLGGVNYASFGQRFAAKVIDVLVIFFGSLVVGILFEKVVRNQATVKLIGNLLGLLYPIVMHAVRGQTVGKILLRIKVVQPDGSNITTGQAIGRTLAEIVSSCILLIGYFMAAFDDQKRALHDRLASTRVIQIDR